MHRLYLLRHAKAAWAAPGMSDFDRPLTEEGRQQCLALGAEMRRAGHRPEIVLCSSARRTRETWDGIAPALGTPIPKPDYTPELYDSDQDQTLVLIRSIAGNGPLLLIGHNPALETLSRILVGGGDSRARRGLRSGFPTGALAMIDFEVPYSNAGAGRGHLSAFIIPAG